MGTDHRFVVAYASVGSGHRMAAEATFAQLTRDGTVDASLVDALEDGRIVIPGDLLTKSFTGMWAPLYDRAWNERGVKVPRAGSGAALAWFYAGLRRRFASARVVACTHGLPAIVADRMREHGADLRIAAVLTDFDAHSQWPVGLDAYCVPSDRARETLVSRGVPEERVHLTGVPLREAFEADVTVRDPHPGRADVVIVAGSSQPGPYKNVRAALPVIVRALVAAGAQVKVIAGDDRSIRPLLAGTPRDAVRVLDRVDDVDRLMREADLFVGKPGGLVCAEALACGTPLLLVGPAWGQERANRRALVDAGAAVVCVQEDAARVVGTLTSDPDRLGRMATAAAGLARPQAARDVASILASLAEPA